MPRRKDLPFSKEYAHIQSPPTSGGHQPLHLSLKVDQLHMMRQCDRLCVCGVVPHWSCVRARSADCRINFAVF